MIATRWGIVHGAFGRHHWRRARPPREIVGSGAPPGGVGRLSVIKIRAPVPEQLVQPVHRRPDPPSAPAPSRGRYAPRSRRRRTRNTAPLWEWITSTVHARCGSASSALARQDLRRRRLGAYGAEGAGGTGVRRAMATPTRVGALPGRGLDPVYRKRAAGHARQTARPSAPARSRACTPRSRVQPR